MLLRPNANNKSDFFIVVLFIVEQNVLLQRIAEE